MFGTAEPLSSVFSVCVIEMCLMMNPDPLSALITFLNHMSMHFLYCGLKQKGIEKEMFSLSCHYRLRYRIVKVYSVSYP